MMMRQMQRLGMWTVLLLLQCQLLLCLCQVLQWLVQEHMLLALGVRTQAAQRPC
jgi:hypothetical protein